MMSRSSLPVWLLVWVLVCAGPALGCEWDRISLPDHGLTFMSLQPLEESCLKTCCDRTSCDLVLLGDPVQGDPVQGGPACREVDCSKEPHLCDLKPSSMFRVYRKKAVRQPEEANNVRCRLPVKVGSCRASFPRFYYNPTNQSCRSFVYGGCQGNNNNFETLQECEVTCNGVSGSVLPDESTPAPESPAEASGRALTPDSKMPAADFTERCGAEPQAGPCRAAFQHWYYNTTTGDCHRFIYGGCQGNKNNYISKESCTAACTGLPSAHKVATDQVSAEYRDSCMVTSDPGYCRAAFPMFYYDPNSASCHSFIYGGCGGNENRYGTVEECMSRCSRDGSFNTRGKTRDHWTPAVFLFVTLAAISALLLATLIIITLRRHGLSRRSSSISDKEELLPDPDDQSSLDSLSVPESPRPDQA